jgi:hypothetical protein
VGPTGVEGIEVDLTEFGDELGEAYRTVDSAR